MKKVKLEVYECEVCGGKFTGPQVLGESITTKCPNCQENIILEAQKMSIYRVDFKVIFSGCVYVQTDSEDRAARVLGKIKKLGGLKKFLEPEPDEELVIGVEEDPDVDPEEVIVF